MSIARFEMPNNDSWIVAYMRELYGDFAKENPKLAEGPLPQALIKAINTVKDENELAKEVAHIAGLSKNNRTIRELVEIISFLVLFRKKFNIFLGKTIGNYEETQTSTLVYLQTCISDFGTGYFNTIERLMGELNQKEEELHQSLQNAANWCFNKYTAEHIFYLQKQKIDKIYEDFQKLLEENQKTWVKELQDYDAQIDQADKALCEELNKLEKQRDEFLQIFSAVDKRDDLRDTDSETLDKYTVYLEKYFNCVNGLEEYCKSITKRLKDPYEKVLPLMKENIERITPKIVEIIAELEKISFKSSLDDEQQKDFREKIYNDPLFIGLKSSLERFAKVEIDSFTKEKEIALKEIIDKKILMDIAEIHIVGVFDQFFIENVKNPIHKLEEKQKRSRQDVNDFLNKNILRVRGAFIVKWKECFPSVEDLAEKSLRAIETVDLNKGYLIARTQKMLVAANQQMFDVANHCLQETLERNAKYFVEDHYPERLKELQETTKNAMKIHFGNLSRAPTFETTGFFDRVKKLTSIENNEGIKNFNDYFTRFKEELERRKQEQIRAEKLRPLVMNQPPSPVPQQPIPPVNISHSIPVNGRNFSPPIAKDSRETKTNFFVRLFKNHWKAMAITGLVTGIIVGSFFTAGILAVSAGVVGSGALAFIINSSLVAAASVGGGMVADSAVATVLGAGIMNGIISTLFASFIGVIATLLEKNKCILKPNSEPKEDSGSPNDDLPDRMSPTHHYVKQQLNRAQKPVPMNNGRRNPRVPLSPAPPQQQAVSPNKPPVVPEERDFVWAEVLFGRKRRR